MKSAICSIAFFLLLALNASTALGCSCSDPSQRKKFRDADYVFLGTAIRMAYSHIQEFPTGVTFKVERQWKGTKLSEPLVNFTFDSPGMCGDLHLAEGQQFLIYAYRQKNDLISYTDCGPNLQVQYAGTEVRKLNSFWFRFFARVIPFG